MLKQVVFVFTTAFSMFINEMLGAGIDIGRFVSKTQVCSPQSVSCSFTSPILVTNFIQLWTTKERRFPELVISKLLHVFFQYCFRDMQRITLCDFVRFER